ncbi:MAG: GNAT family N-acetyltransferase [Spirochaetaceae bacterium]
MIELREVVSKRDLREFISFPYRLYKDHPYWVPPLYFDEKNTLSPKKNPAFSHCDARYWLAQEDGRTLGRIAAIRNDRYIEKWGNHYLRFGWLDLENRNDVADVLFRAVEDWAAEQGLAAVHGPLGFTDLDREGILVEGFEEKETLPMIYNYPYYPTQMERLGYVKDVDWLQFSIKVPEKLSPKFGRLKKVVMERNKLQLREFTSSREVISYADKAFEVLNEAYKDLYGVVELDSTQVRYYIKQYFSFVRPEFIKLMEEEEGDVVAFAIALPRLTDALQKTEGKLLPFGFIHLLHAMKKPSELVFYLIGIRPAYQNRGLNAVLLTELYRECREHGIHTVQTCGELEHNSNVVTLMKNFEHRLNKRRRCYIKTL